MDMRDEDYTVQSPVLTLEINSVGSLKFTIHPNHPEFDSIKTLTSIVKVYKITGPKKKWLFSGRVMTMENDIRNSGQVDCEGVMAFLCDSIVTPYEYKGTPADYVLNLVNSHNKQVDEGKRFTIGVLDLADADSNNYITRANSNYPDTLAEINDKVVKLLNAYISVREESGKLYFDCNQTITHINTQRIEFGENIIDISKTVTAEEIKTVMIGRGAEDDEGNRLTVMAENADAIAKYGRIVGTVEFENVSTDHQLALKTAAYLDSVLGIKNTVEVKAIDLNMTDSDIQEISLGHAYVTSRQNDLDNEWMLISKMQLHLMEPENSTFTLGATKATISSTFSHTKAEINNKVQQAAKNTSRQLEHKISNATQLITGAQGGYVILDCGEDAKSQPSQILIMDTPDKKTAASVIRINKNGIGFSTTGYDGPYANAWTIDGNLVADFITVGTMFADRIRGGTLEIGGEKDGVIAVIDKNKNTVALIDKEGIAIYKGSIRGSTIVVGGTYNADGSITVLDESGNIVATINKDGVNVLKGKIRGSTITVGGTDNADGSITVLDSSGSTNITIDVNGINVNDKFKIDMNGNMEAISISGDAVDQISDIIDSSDAMKTAKEAIKTAQGAAETAQKTAETANSAAETAQEAAETAQSAAETAQGAAETAQKTAETANSAAETAQKTDDALGITVENLNNMVDKINGWIMQLDKQIKELGKDGISG